MSTINFPTRPSSWDRDMQGLDEDPESENLVALGMHLMAANDDDEEEEEEGEKEIDAESEDEEEDDKDEPEELDELEELERLAKVLKQESEPALIIDEEE